MICMGRSAAGEKKSLLLLPVPPVRLRLLVADRLALVGGALPAVFVLAGIFAPWLAPNDPLAVNLANTLQPAGGAYPLGTDHLGRCVLSRIIWGTRVTLSTSFLVVVTIMVISVPYGMLAGWFGGWLDNVLMRLVDIVLAFPNTGAGDGAGHPGHGLADTEHIRAVFPGIGRPAPHS
jgi:ABC-type dipeptide/oligopeptide/nickel transport system permease subunit